ncbi:hypothetical protein RBB50_002493 [Rhinocladiella similis]
MSLSHCTYSFIQSPHHFKVNRFRLEPAGPLGPTAEFYSRACLVHSRGLLEMIPTAALVVLIAVVALATSTFCLAIYCSISDTFRSKITDKNKNESNVIMPLTEAAADMASIPHAEPFARPETPEAESPPPLPDEFESFAGAVSSQTHSTATKTSTREAINLYTIDAQNKASVPRSAPATITSFGQAPPASRTIFPPVPEKSAPPTITTFAQAESKWAYFGEKRAMNHII